MELKITLSDERVDLEAVNTSVKTALDELVADLGLPAGLNSRVLTGADNSIFLDDDPIPFWDRSVIPKTGEVPEPGLLGALFKWRVKKSHSVDAEKVSRSVIHSVMLQRWKLSRLAFPTGAGQSLCRFIEELAQRCISLKRLDNVDLSDLAGRSRAELEDISEALLERSEIRLMVPEGQHALTHVDIGEKDPMFAAVRDERPAAALIRAQLRESLGLLLPGISEIEVQSISEPDTADFRLKLNDVSFPSIENDHEALDQLKKLLARNTAALVTTESTRLGLHQLRVGGANNIRFPDLVDAVVELYGINTITRVLRYLADESVNIGRLRAILDAMFEVMGTTAADENTRIVIQPHIGKLYPATPGGRIEILQSEHMAECVRMSLGRQLANDAIQELDGIRTFLLEPDIETWLATESEIDPKRHSALIKALERANKDHPEVNVILTNTTLRRKLWELIHASFPQFRVLSFQELEADETIFGIDRIKLT